MKGYYETEFRKKVAEASKRIAASGGNRKEIEGILLSLMTPGEARAIVSNDGENPMILWLPEDVKTLRPRWSNGKCAEALCDASKSLVDRSVEYGWDVLSCCLELHEEDRKQA